MDDCNYFRRCHVCGALNQSQLFHIDHCEHCTKPFAQFQFFDDRESPVPDDRKLRPAALHGAFEPLRGITVFWDKP